MKHNIFSRLAAAAALLAVCYACENEDYKIYDVNQKDSVFITYSTKDEVDSVYYRFNYDISETHDIEIPYSLMGMPCDRDRTIALQPVDGSTMKEGTHYTISNNVLKAGEVEGKIVVTLIRNNDATLQEKALDLELEIVENDDFRAVGKSHFKICFDDIRPSTRPDWWVTYGMLPVYSFENAQLFFSYFYELAPKANKTVFDEMIVKYGEYFKDAASMLGPMAMYETFLVRNVLIPLYNDHHDDVDWQDIPTLR